VMHCTYTCLVAISGPSVRARRDRQSLLKNKPQPDDKHGEDADELLHDAEPNATLVPLEKELTIDNSTGASGKQISSGMSLSDEVGYPVVQEGRVVPKTKDSTIDVPVSNRSSSPEPASSNSRSRLLTDMQRNVISATEFPDASAEPRHRESEKSRVQLAAASRQPLPKKIRSPAVDCSRIASSSGLHHHKTDGEKSAGKQLTANDKCGGFKVRCSSGDHRRKAISNVRESEQKSAQNGNRDVPDDSTNAAVGVLTSDVSAASAAQSNAFSLSRQVTGNSTTAGSTVDTNKLQPTASNRVQSRVRYEGAHCLLRLLRLCDVVLFSRFNFCVELAGWRI